jgi:hypothetical protein
MSMCRYMTIPQLLAVQPRVDIVEYAMCKYLHRYLTLCILLNIVINVEWCTWSDYLKSVLVFITVAFACLFCGV